MADRGADPYQTLGVRPDVADTELRVAYRRLVQLHHPDHNGGSAESARRFEDVQEAYAQIRTMRQAVGAGQQPGRGAGASRPAGGGASRPAGGGASRPATAGADPDIEARLADLERELNAARETRERARQAAREAAREQAAREASDGTSTRPSDEELGYIKTDDSFTKILADAATEISEHLSDAREHDVPKRVADLIDELAAKLTGEPPAHQ